jgi:hypothetical protein
MTVKSDAERTDLLALMLLPIPDYSFDPIVHRRVGLVVAESCKSKPKKSDD